MSLRKAFKRTIPFAVCAASLSTVGHAAAPSLTSGTYTTADAASDQAKLCPAGQGYPQETPWLDGYKPAPVSATSGTPRIEQYRQGQLIATYSSFSDQPGCSMAGDGTDYQHPAAPAASGCGPFTRVHTWRLWSPGDVFLVYPAIYAGEYNQPWIGPEYTSPTDYNNGVTVSPDNILIQGVVQNGTRPAIVLAGPTSNNTLGQAPVYFDVSTGVTMDSINVSARGAASAGKAGIYEVAGSNLTLSNMRISNFRVAGANGLFGAGQYSGALTLSHLELDHNGGTNGPAHNAYITASAVDPNFTVYLLNSWSHDAYYGHLFKSRAQNGVFTANFFQGGLPMPNYTQAETYLLDVPNGGQVVLRNNVFVKNASGANSNAMSFTFLLEGTTDNRPQSLDVENNTFVTFAKTYDGAHVNYPMAFLTPNVRPDSSSWPSTINARVIKNAFLGYCTPGNGGTEDYRGDIALMEGFAELTKSYVLRTKVTASDSAMSARYSNYTNELGTLAGTMQYDVQLFRQHSTIGGQD